MKPEHGANPESYGVEEGHSYHFAHTAPLAQIDFNGYRCLIIMTPGEQVELKDDGYLLKPLLCIRDGTRGMIGWREGHTHRTLFTVKG